jgi:hypothetical protein
MFKLNWRRGIIEFVDQSKFHHFHLYSWSMWATSSFYRTKACLRCICSLTFWCIITHLTLTHLSCLQHLKWNFRSFQDICYVPAAWNEIPTSIQSSKWSLKLSDKRQLKQNIQSYNTYHVIAVFLPRILARWQMMRDPYICQLKKYTVYICRPHLTCDMQ